MCTKFSEEILFSVILLISVLRCHRHVVCWMLAAHFFFFFFRFCVFDMIILKKPKNLFSHFYSHSFNTKLSISAERKSKGLLTKIWNKTFCRRSCRHTTHIFLPAHWRSHKLFHSMCLSSSSFVFNPLHYTIECLFASAVAAMHFLTKKMSSSKYLNVQQKAKKCKTRRIFKRDREKENKGGDQEGEIKTKINMHT